VFDFKEEVSRSRDPETRPRAGERCRSKPRADETADSFL
jgi:hypothetical protein